MHNGAIKFYYAYGVYCLRTILFLAKGWYLRAAGMLAHHFLQHAESINIRAHFLRMAMIRYFGALKKGPAPPDTAWKPPAAKPIPVEKAKNPVGRPPKYHKLGMP